MVRLFLSRGSLLVMVAGSLIFALLRGFMINGSVVALILAILGQLVLPGWLLLRLWDGRRADHILVRLMWVLAGGISLTILLGSLFRLLGLPIWLYVLVLHLIMAGLALRPPAEAGPAESAARQPVRVSQMAVYGLLVVCSLTSMAVGTTRSQLRWDAWEDPATFASWINWLVNDPEDPWRLSRRVTDTPDMIDERYHSDGWPFVEAAWLWSSGVDAPTFIWYLVTPMFAWLTPLVYFAFIYELSRNVRLAVFSTAALTLLSLLSLDYIGYDTFFTAFAPYYGANAFEYLNISRYFSVAIVLPLALMAAVSYLQRPARAKLWYALLAAPTLGLLHAKAITIFVISIGAFAAVYWLAHRTRSQMLVSLRIGVVLVVGMAVPVVQRYVVVPAGAVEGQVAQVSGGLFPGVLQVDVPLIGETLIVRPELVFYHPLMVAGVGLGLLALVLSRRPEALFASGVTAAFLALMLLPGLAAIFITLVSPRIAHNFAIGLPIGLGLGLLLDGIAASLPRRKAAATAISILMTLVILVVLLEPVPILAASGRDQIRVMNDLQSARDIRPADEALLDLLTSDPDLMLTSPTVIMTPIRISSYIVETVPHALVVIGGEGEDDLSQYLGQFFSSTSTRPFLDSLDLAFLDRWDVRCLVLEATDTRLPQVEMRPDRFRRMGAVDGYRVYEVLDIQPDESDALFQEMNARFAAGPGTRWEASAFELVRPGGAGWQDMAAAWQDRPQNDDRQDERFGLAMSLLLAGDDTLALWEELAQAYPEVPLLMEAAAETSRHLGQGDAAVARLLAGLGSPQAGVRVRAAMLLLTDDFWYDINAAAIERVIETVHQDAASWDLLAEMNPDAIRQRSALLISRGYGAEADEMMSRLTPMEVSPSDLLFRAALRLADGRQTEALALLVPYHDPDMYVAAQWWHPDRWQVNTAAGLHHLLQGQIAADSGDWPTAVDLYMQAVDQGYGVAGRVFAARALYQGGETAEAAALLETLAAQPDDQAALWAAATSLELAQLDQDRDREAGALTALNQALARLDLPPVVADDAPRLHSWLELQRVGQTEVLAVRTGVDGLVRVRGLFGPNPLRVYPVEAWEARLFDPVTYQTYGDVRLAAQLVPGALTEWTIELAPEETAPYTPAWLALEAWSEGAVRYQRAEAELTLHPVSADDAAIAQETSYVFDDQIRLVGYTGPEVDPQSLTLTLYWQTDQALSGDYQVLFHIIDETGLLVAQGDGVPVSGRYPTSRWAPGLLIEDRRTVDLDAPLPPGRYRGRIGLYRLEDGVRLALLPADDNVDDSTVLVEFRVPPDP